MTETHLNRKCILFLIISGWVIALIAAVFQSVPGYMDAEYYYSGALRLASGQGWNEMILWNYLDQPAGLPHPAHIYWMPLASFLVVPGLWLFQTDNFLAARIMPIILCGFIPVISALISFNLSRNQRHALLAGLLSLFPGFYLVYITNTETFTPYMLTGGLFMLAASRDDLYKSFKPWFFLGLITGTMHLARADGVLWLMAGFMLLFFSVWQTWKQYSFLIGRIIGQILLLTAGYLLVMSPWLVRNYLIFGVPFPPGTSRTLWMTSYNQLFVFPADNLSFANWWSSGLFTIVSVRASALWDNLKTFVGVQGEVFLLPLILLGAYQLRRKKMVWLGLAMWLLTLVSMSLFFPFAGSRGGFFHSGSAFQPFFWALVPVGLELAVQWGSRVRKWNRKDSYRVFSAGVVILSGLMTLFLYAQMVIGSDPGSPIWSRNISAINQIENFLQEQGAGNESAVLINNPPGYYSVTHRPALVIPDGPLNTTLAVAHKYHVSYLVLETNHVEGMEDVYRFPLTQNGLTYLGQVNDAVIFRINP